MIVDRGFNTHLIRVYLGKDAQGTRKFVSETLHGTISQARARERALKGKKDVGVLVAPTKLTTAAFLKTWLEGKIDLGPKTKMDYDHRIKKDVYPSTLAGLPLAKVTPLHIQALYGSLLSDRELSPRTVRYTHSILRQAFQWAVDAGQLGRNPCDLVVLPKQPKREMKILSPEEAGTLIDATDGTQNGVMWRTMLTTGLRMQEVVALTWDDFDGSSLTVRRAIVEVRPGHWDVKEDTKTVGSVRTVSLAQATIVALQQHKARQAEAILKAGAGYARKGFIFASNRGSFRDPANLRKDWKAVLTKLKLPLIRLYDSRHTHASHLLAAGANVKAVSARLGHANPNMTLAVYAHCIPGADRELADAQERVLQNARRVTDRTLQVVG